MAKHTENEETDPLIEYFRPKPHKGITEIDGGIECKNLVVEVRVISEYKTDSTSKISLLTEAERIELIFKALWHEHDDNFIVCDGGPECWRHSDEPEFIDFSKALQHEHDDKFVMCDGPGAFDRQHWKDEVLSESEDFSTSGHSSDINPPKKHPQYP